MKKFIEILKVVIVLSLFGYIIYHFYTNTTYDVFLKQIYVENKFAIIEERMHNQNIFYNKQFIKKQNPNILNNAQNPYIPDGFRYVEGEWNSGFVIEDESGNQFVWIPCSNEKNDLNIPILKKENVTDQQLIDFIETHDEYYENFLNSVLENGGFYVSRYEIGNDNNNPVSKSGVEVYTGITQEKAIDIASKMYKNVNCELINGYAYDTMLHWTSDNGTPVVSEYYDKNNEKLLTGRNSNKNIFDIYDNVMEMSMENTYENVIIRGVQSSSFDLFEVNDLIYRCSIEKEKDFYSVGAYLTMRFVLYK